MQACVDRAVVRCAWQRLLPGLVEHYDSQYSLPCIAPRPLLIVNGQLDIRCPIAGLQEPIVRCQRAYSALNAGSSFDWHIEENAGHEVTDRMDCVVEDFFLKALRPDGFEATLGQLDTDGGRHRAGKWWWWLWSLLQLRPVGWGSRTVCGGGRAQRGRVGGKLHRAPEDMERTASYKLFEDALMATERVLVPRELDVMPNCGAQC
jgi:hypothetical protein